MFEFGKEACRCRYNTHPIIDLFAIHVCAEGVSEDEKRRLKEQHYIDYDKPIYEGMFIGTHNSYNNKDDGYDPISNVGVALAKIPGLNVFEFLTDVLSDILDSLNLGLNHVISVEKQLNMGMRALNLDVHGQCAGEVTDATCTDVTDVVVCRKFLNACDHLSTLPWNAKKNTYNLG